MRRRWRQYLNSWDQNNAKHCLPTKLIRYYSIQNWKKFCLYVICIVYIVYNIQNRNKWIFVPISFFFLVLAKMGKTLETCIDRQYACAGETACCATKCSPHISLNGMYLNDFRSTWKIHRLKVKFFLNIQNNDWLGKGLGYYMDLNGRIFNEIHSISSVFLAFSNINSTWNWFMIHSKLQWNILRMV